MVTVRAPATSANLGSGFDVFGAALSKPADVVRVEPAEATTIEMAGAGSEFIPEDPEKNVAGAVAKALESPATIRIDKGVRPSSGLGSSAASAAAVAVGINAAYDLGYSREELVPYAAEGEALVSGEAHADNVAPSIMGGFTIATPEGVTQVDASIPLVVCLPEIVISTRDARRVVPRSAQVSQIVECVGRAATLVAGMFRDDPDLVGQGMEDGIVTPARADLIDGYADVREAALEAGATGVTVSGAGPAIIAACEERRRKPIASAMLDRFAGEGIEARAYQTRVGRGAELF
ncbi:homoserine kinase [Halalkalicoccus jeotgali]|uniref:Homoserine kinase n=1 Tax=Halalkalicoccus jeotgali (strain DSM 18796 / CECT 7217 / JCM 14584 / KCTC 4019 / B3) TaxID=795797 RepID=D8JAB0_HALJB|nr:homoserine kinase [Halalkalicoccus jeotgali]ADJ14632.1 homoserine kinase [Halalkalicoccus jeotgali B3]ELY39531.1 homoserine kinase [Halalkalicoccus jeotgali B3]